MKASNVNRRTFLTSFSALICGAAFWRKADAATLTPRATEGPFYPTPAMRKPDIDNDLVKIIGQVREAGGEVFTLKGRVTDEQGTPREGIRVEIWQCDMNGKYMHPGDTRDVSYDVGFQGFGHDVTGPDGEYSFRTIKPGKYPGRTEHIHVKFLDGSRELLTTQFYEADNPNNDDDTLYQRLSSAQANTVSMTYQVSDDGVEATVNIII